MRICNSNKEITAFWIRYNHFKYQVILFGFSNTLANFQGYVNKILVEKLNIFITIYLDDILIYIKDLGQPYIKTVYLVLDQLRKYLFFANLKKYYFYEDRVYFLRYIMLSKSINIGAKRFEVMWKWPEPKSI